MPLFPYPSPEEIKSETRLTPAQLGPTVTTATYATDIEDRIGEEAALAEATLTGRFSAASLESLSDNDQKLGKKWIELRVAASLYHSAGQLNEKYKDEALDYERRAAQYGETLLASLGAVQSALPVIQNKSFSVSPRRIDGYSGCGDEYSRSGLRDGWYGRGC